MSAATTRFVLPAHVQLVPAEAFSPTVRAQFGARAGDHIVSQLYGRAASIVVDGETAALLQYFRTPSTIAAALIAFGREAQVRPEDALTQVFPVLQRLAERQLLVSEDAVAAKPVAESFQRGACVAGFAVVRCVQLLGDVELYQVRTGGRWAALKVARPETSRAVHEQLAREAALLERLAGDVAPRLLATGSHENRPFLLMEWCSGTDPARVAAELRTLPRLERRPRLVTLGIALLGAYARLHARGVVHGDVHAHNALVSREGDVRLVDFGYARCPELAMLRDVPRAGLAFFYEPELAAAELAAAPAPPASAKGEQYALGALLYALFTGVHRADFSLERHEMLSQLARARPLPFAGRGVEAWPRVERVLRRALARDPNARYESVAAFADALRATATRPRAEARRAGPTSTALSADAGDLLNAVLRHAGLGSDTRPERYVNAPTASVHHGAAGLAYALYRIATLREDATLLALADLHATRAAADAARPDAFYSDALDVTRSTVGEISLLYTAAGVHCVRALVANAMGDDGTRSDAIHAFVAASSAHCVDPDLAIGRSGTALGCALLLEALGGAAPHARGALLAVGAEAIQQADARLAEAESAEGGETLNLGVAHGIAGVTFACLRMCAAAGLPLPATMVARLQRLSDAAEPAGRGVRWPWISDARQGAPVYQAGWCNGSAGFVHLWLLAWRMLGEARFLELADGAAWHAWEQSNGSADLCCGYAGRAYALLEMHKHVRDPIWLRRAVALAERSVAALPAREYARDGLYKGSVGVALLVADLEQPEHSCMPMFGHEGWVARGQAPM